MFENVREWLRKGRIEKTIGFIILFLGVYGILWGIVEPIISSDVIEKHFPDALKHWWKFQIIITILITLGLFVWLYPNKIIQSFDLKIFN